MNKVIAIAVLILTTAFITRVSADAVLAAPNLNVNVVPTAPGYANSYKGLSGGSWSITWSDLAADTLTPNYWSTVQITQPVDMVFKTASKASFRETLVDSNYVFAIEGTWKREADLSGAKVLMKIYSTGLIGEVKASLGASNPPEYFDDWTGVTKIQILARGTLGGRQKTPGGWYMDIKSKQTAEAAQTLIGKWGDYYFKASFGSSLSETEWKWITLSKSDFVPNVSTFSATSDVFSDVYTMEFRTDYRNVAGEMPTVGSVDRLQIAAIVLVGSKSSVGTSYFTPSQLNASLKGLPQMETGIVHYEKRTGLSVIDFGKPGLASVYDLTGKLLKTTSDFSQINSMQKGVYIVKIMQNGKNFKRVFSTVK